MLKRNGNECNSPTDCIGKSVFVARTKLTKATICTGANSIACLTVMGGIQVMRIMRPHAQLLSQRAQALTQPRSWQTGTATSTQAQTQSTRVQALSRLHSTPADQSFTLKLVYVSRPCADGTANYRGPAERPAGREAQRACLYKALESAETTKEFF